MYRTVFLKACGFISLGLFALSFFVLPGVLPGVLPVRAETLEHVTVDQLRTPLFRLAYVAETWGELFPCPG